MDSFAPENRKKLIWLSGGFFIGVLTGVVAITISVFIAGSGHGNYVPAKLFFPYKKRGQIYFQFRQRSHPLMEYWCEDNF